MIRANGDGTVVIVVEGRAAEVACLALPTPNPADEGTLAHGAVAQGALAVVAYPRVPGQLPTVLGWVSTAQIERLMALESGTDVVSAHVDGKRMRLCAEDEIVLECGKASITLRRNGRVVIRGAHVESRSDGTNQIKGGHVRIN